MPDFKGRTVLVVDDERDIREILFEEFSYFGAEVLLAANGLEAMAILLGRRVDYVFSDVLMPVMGGLELVKEIKAKLDYTPKIFLATGYTSMPLEALRPYNVLRIFRKPFKIETVVTDMLT